MDPESFKLEDLSFKTPQAGGENFGILTALGAPLPRPGEGKKCAAQISLRISERYQVGPRQGTPGIMLKRYRSSAPQQRQTGFFLFTSVFFTARSESANETFSRAARTRSRSQARGTLQALFIKP